METVMNRLLGTALGLCLVAMAHPAQGQWFEFEDPISGSVCGVINAENVRLVLSNETGNLVRISGADRNLANTGVTEGFEVVIDDQFVGLIEFARDDNGRVRAFWTTELGTLYGLTTDGTPVETDVFPEDDSGLCDPCELWDNTDDCLIQPEDPGDTITPLCGSGAATAMIALLGIGLTMRLSGGRRRR
jgi:hypothetical protein